MTKKDLSILYKKETGLDIPNWNYKEDYAAMEKYIQWLEEKLINLYNA